MPAPRARRGSPALAAVGYTSWAPDPISRPLRRALTTFAQRVRDELGPRVREVRLFGSYARGGANEESDVDVLVVVDALSSTERATVATLAATVAIESGLPLAPLPLATDELARMRRLRASLRSPRSRRARAADSAA